MKKPLLALSLISLSLTFALPTFSVSAVLPSSVDGAPIPSLSPMLKRVMPAVVMVSVDGNEITKQPLSEKYRFSIGENKPNTQTLHRPFKSLGSGVIIDNDKGYIVTNYHVVKNAVKIKVKLADGRQVKASLVGSDELSDIALIKLDVKTDNLTQVTIADSDNIQVGDFAVAIGNPFGLGQTVTSGIISALGRSGLNIENFENFIQTDAAINSGNSGGALVNLNGELVGINTAILGASGGNIGIGFAIPSNMVTNLTHQLIEFGEVKRGMLGVQGGEVTPGLAQAMGYKNNKGAFISKVTVDGAAHKGGILAGDVIVSINNKSINTFEELRAKIASIGAKKKVKLGLLRSGKAIDVDVTLAEAKKPQTDVADLSPGLAGATFTDTNNAKVKGVVVANIEKGTAAEYYQLQKGDVIIAVNRTLVENLNGLKAILEEKPDVLALNIQRGDQTVYVVIQ